MKNTVKLLTLIGIITIVFVIVYCLNMFSIFRLKDHHLYGKQKLGYSRGTSGIDHLVENYNDPMNVIQKNINKQSMNPNKIGQYDGLKLEQNENDQMNRTVFESNDNNVVIQGYSVPLENELVQPIEDSSKKSMFIFKNNESNPNCCPSTFSDSKGCICTSEEQRDYINKRGGNRTLTSVY